ncbi:glycosyltransferase [Dietzia sp. B32]|uniref:glycosyltransferase n=1 Tax=Dietzia sp. B32 TaxID=2915130 RepID=UPI0037BFB464
MPTVVILVNDPSLGGTSRSAVQFARCWRSIGFEVWILPTSTLHPSRVDEAEQAGATVLRDSGARPPKIDVVHFHHTTIEPLALEVLAQLLASDETGSHPRLLTHNIFAEDDCALDELPVSRTVGLMSGWCSLQYRSATGIRLSSRTRIIELPNPQNDRYFRPPSRQEWVSARQRFAGGAERVLLRIGSPIDSKWHSSYIELATRLPSSWLLVLVGCPPELCRKLEPFQNVIVQPSVSDDAVLREYYWSADVFVHAAQKGESFGNVIHESLLCGTPVVYYNRPFRDNSPIVLGSIDGFVHESTPSKWVSRCLAVESGSKVGRGEVVSISGRDAVARKLKEWFEGTDYSTPSMGVALLYWPFIFAGNNALARIMKKQLHRLRKTRATRRS